MNIFLEKYKSWRYKNTFFLIISLFVVYYFFNTEIGYSFVHSVKSFGYTGAFFAGIFFVSTFTVVPAGIVLFNLAQNFNPLMVATLAGMGAVLGDYIIFRYLKDYVFEEIKPVFMRLGGSHISRILSTPYFGWLAPVLGALIIASPFPDEIGVSLMGISKLKNWQFLTISFILNALGILLIITVAESV